MGRRVSSIPSVKYFFAETPYFVPFSAHQTQNMLLFRSLECSRCPCAAKNPVISSFLQYCAEHHLSVVDPHEADISLRVFSDFVTEYLSDHFGTDEED